MKIACDLNYIIDIPSNAKKEDLFDLKDFLDYLAFIISVWYQ